MNPSEVIGDVLAGAEDALDRLKLAYKERFERFDPARPVPYRGYGRPDRLLLRGRVLEDTETGFEPESGVWTSMRNTLRRLETDEIRGARLRATFRDIEVEAEADDEAFFEFRFDPDPPVDPGWHEVRVEVIESMAHEHVGPVTGEVMVVGPEPDHIVVSDLDDTVVRTGARSRFRMFRTVLLNDAHTRTPFEGVTAFYHALRDGPGNHGSNPFFYLSRSAWNMYDMLAGFLDHRDLPKGPLLLKDYGLRSAIGAKEESHKRDTIVRLMDFFDDGPPFVLIGDSGQRDPETYRDMAIDHADRIRAIIIRDVTPDERDREVRRIADEIEDLDVPMIIANDSVEAARKAADLGLIDPGRVDQIDVDRSNEEDAPSRIRRWLDGSTDRSGAGD